MYRRIISDLIFSFFCTCAELAVVSRQKDKVNKVRFLSDNSKKKVTIGVCRGGKIEIQRHKIFSFMVFFFVKKKRKTNRKIIQIALIVCVMNLIRILIGRTKAFTQLIYEQ